MMIRESIITTLSAAGALHIAPMGVIWREELPVLAPFRPSRTLDNLRENPCAVINHTDDVRLFAGCLTGRRDWPTGPAETIRGAVIEGALSHQEITVESVEDDPVRRAFAAVSFTRRPIAAFSASTARRRRSSRAPS